MSTTTPRRVRHVRSISEIENFSEEGIKNCDALFVPNVGQELVAVTPEGVLVNLGVVNKLQLVDEVEGNIFFFNTIELTHRYMSDDGYVMELAWGVRSHLKLR